MQDETRQAYFDNGRTTMKNELFKLRAQVAVLKDIMKEYSGRTIDNIVTNIEARIKYIENAKNDLL